MEVSFDLQTAETDLRGWADLMVEAFAVDSIDHALEYARRYPAGDVLVARDAAGASGRVLGGLGLTVAKQRWGGRDVPFAGVAAVCTSAEARGRGVASGLMKKALAVMNERGHLVSALYPASVSLYRKAGYEIVGAVSRMRLRVAELGLGPRAGDARWVVRSITPDEVFAADVDRLAGAGNLVAREAFFRGRAFPERSPSRTFGIFDTKGALRGGVALGRSQADHGRHDLHLRLWWADDDAVLSRLLDFIRHHGSLARYATWLGAPTDRLVMGLPTEAWEVERVSPWMFRVVDFAGAVAARGYLPGMGGEFELGVVDPVCAWNHGRWRVEVAGGVGRATRIGHEPDDAAEVVDACELARLYTGELVETTRIGACFAGAAPWLNEGF